MSTCKFYYQAYKAFYYFICIIQQNNMNYRFSFCVLSLKSSLLLNIKLYSLQKSRKYIRCIRQLSFRCFMRQRSDFYTRGVLLNLVQCPFDCGVKCNKKKQSFTSLLKPFRLNHQQQPLILQLGEYFIVIVSESQEKQNLMCFCSL